MKGEEVREHLLSWLLTYEALVRWEKVAEEWDFKSNTPYLKEFVKYLTFLEAKLVEAVIEKTKLQEGKIMELVKDTLEDKGGLKGEMFHEAISISGCLPWLLEIEILKSMVSQVKVGKDLYSIINIFVVHVNPNFEAEKSNVIREMNEVDEYDCLIVLDGMIFDPIFDPGGSKSELRVLRNGSHLEDSRVEWLNEEWVERKSIRIGIG
ncbi:hypothetical protein ACH5RR_041385 [Cinchona calisaya]|uniref:Uncharacterized protein n=1 Tax=Cinchona calisaya TaxID=153742 RepID=A0ABD2XUQ7_9GENT